MSLTLSIILAIAFDVIFGEPQRGHPLVAFGRYLRKLEVFFLNEQRSILNQYICGLIALALALVPFIGLAYLLEQFHTLSTITAPIILYFCIAPTSLRNHALAVFIALELKDLEQARKNVGMIVSRDTQNMSWIDIRRACIESVLENGSDAIFAPLFWFALCGPTAALAYRLCNTLDASWGYKTPHFTYFGWASARVDDVLNYIPARLTAISYAALGNTSSAIECWYKQAKFCSSPNGGPVMTAGAGALNIQLGGSASYNGIVQNKPYFGTNNTVTNHDIEDSIRLILKTLALWVVIIAFLNAYT